MKCSRLLLLLMYCMSFFSSNSIDATSYDTTSGVDLNKAIVVAAQIPMSGDVLLGTVEAKAGINLSGSATIGTNLPVRKSIVFNGFTGILMTNDLHLAGDNGSFLLDNSASAGYFGTSIVGNNQYTIYLDSDVTISGIYPIYLSDVIIDGQGHEIDFTHSINGGVVLSRNGAIIKNVTLKNVWFSQESGTGNFLIEGANSDFDSSTVTFDNVNIIARKFHPFAFDFNAADYPDVVAHQHINIKNNVVLSNFGNFTINNRFSGPSGFGLFTILNNSNLVVENSTLSLGTTSIITSPDHVLFFVFESDTAGLVLNNAAFVVDNNNFDNNFAFDATVTLSVGTIMVKGNSYLEADSLLRRNGKSSLRIGSGVSTAGDMNIIIDPGATLNLVSTNTNCSVKLQNVH
ncbi:MAG: hypothetical protein WCW33_05910 [Candidatus Babeliales bacterium]